MATDGTVREWEAGSGRETARHELGAEGADLQVASLGPEARVLLALSRSRQARLWRRSGAGFELIARPGNAAPADHAALSPDGSRALIGLRSGRALVLDTDSGEVTRELVGHQAAVVHGSFRADGAVAVTASGDRTARVWDVASGAAIAVLRGHLDRLRSALFGGEGRLIATASVDGSVRLWEAETGRELMVMELGPALSRTAISPDGRWVAGAGTDGSAAVWPAGILAAARERFPQPPPPDLLDRYEAGGEAERKAARLAWERERVEADLAAIEPAIAAGSANRSLHELYAERFSRLVDLWRNGAGEEVLAGARRRAEAQAEAGRTNAPELLGILAGGLAEAGRLREAVEALEAALELPAVPGGLADLLARCRRQALPDLPTYGSVDAALDYPEPGLGERDVPPRDGEQWHAFRSLVAAGGGGAGADARLRYLEARLLQGRGRHEEAVRMLEALQPIERSRPQPALLLAGSLTALGRSAGAEAALRAAIASARPLARNRWLVEAWFGSCIELGLGRKEIEHRLEGLLAGAGQSPDDAGPLPDLAWALRTLGRGGRLRIDCGGESFLDSGGAVWGRDRFFTSGDGFWNRRYGAQSPRTDLPIEGTEDDDLYRDGRLFPAGAPAPKGYRIPCLPGRYRVVLHFAGVFPLPRNFDIVVERQPLARGFDPGKGGSVARSLAAEVEVADSSIDIELVTFRSRASICALEVETVRAPPR